MNHYDSRPETEAHIARVQDLLHEVDKNMHQRAWEHDFLKLLPPEKAVFDAMTPLLTSLTYDSPEYKESLKKLGVALQHHYAAYSHHPEHFESGVNGMSLLDLMEMLADHKAAGERHADGNIWVSMEKNRIRFGYSDQLYEILCNTIRELGWG